MGSSGKGTLTIQDGGTVSAAGLTIASSGFIDRRCEHRRGFGRGSGGRRHARCAHVTFGAAGNGTLNFNHIDTSGDYLFAAAVSSISGAGTINHRAGVTTLSGASGGFSGATTVSGGTLLVDGTLGGTVAVGTGASLGGIGRLAGAVSIANGGTLLGQQGETLTMGSLALGNSSNVNVALGAPGNALALFNVTGNLTLDGLLNVEDLGGFGAGVYRIFDYGGVLTNNSLADRNDAVGYAGKRPLHSDRESQRGQSGQQRRCFHLQLLGGGSGLWNTVNSNWTDADGTVTGAWSNGEFATFQGYRRHCHRGCRGRHLGRWHALRSRRLHDHRRPDRAAK